MDYVVIQTTGNATDFGDTTFSRYNTAGTGGDTRGLFAGGRSATASTWYDNIEYITIESTGNATDFGDLTEQKDGPPGFSNNGTRACFVGGHKSPANKNTIEFVVIATTGNATDVGDLLAANSGMTSSSGAP